MTRRQEGTRRSRWRDSIAPERLSLVPGQVVIPNLRLTRQIAEGGMGNVWEAEHLSLKSKVAVKFVLSEHRDNRTATTRFEGEAMASARLRSPHIVQVFDQGITEDGLRYMIMELLEGEDLETRLDREPQLPLPLCATIVAQTAKALSKAHQLGVIHRDIKPSNIFLTDSDGEPFVKILDFGIAKVSLADVANLRVTQTGAVIGTPAFMAPEQMTHAKDVGPAADMWSLAVVAYYSLCGRLPYESETLAGLAMAIERGVFPDPSSLVATLPAELDLWFRVALAKDPSARFASAREMATKLIEIAQIDPPASMVTSAPPPPLDDDATEVSLPGALEHLSRGSLADASPEPAKAKSTEPTPASEPTAAKASSSPGKGASKSDASSERPKTKSSDKPLSDVEKVKAAIDELPKLEDRPSSFDAKAAAPTGRTLSDVATSVPDLGKPKGGRVLLWASLAVVAGGLAYGASQWGGDPVSPDVASAAPTARSAAAPVGAASPAPAVVTASEPPGSAAPGSSAEPSASASGSSRPAASSSAAASAKPAVKTPGPLPKPKSSASPTSAPSVTPPAPTATSAPSVAPKPPAPAPT